MSVDAGTTSKRWDTEGQDEYLAHYDPSVAGVDKEFEDCFGAGNSCQAVLAAALDALGLTDRSAIKVLEIGCNAGNKLAVLAALGCSRDNLYGVDLSPKALDVARNTIPSANLRCVKVDAPFEYKFDEVSFDLVFCCATLPHVPPESRGEFLAQPKRLGAKYFMFIEPFAPEPTFKDWEGWAFYFDNFPKFCDESPALGARVYERFIPYDEKTKEMFAPMEKEAVFAYAVA